MPSQIPAAPLDSVVVGPDAAVSPDKSSDEEIKQTNIEVCARVRPLLVTPTGAKFFDRRGHAGSRRPMQLSMSGSRPSRPSRLPSISKLPSPSVSKLPSPRKPPVPPRSASRGNFHGDDKDAAAGDRVPSYFHNSEPPLDNSISAWDVIGDATVSQTEASNPIQGRTTSYNLDRVYGPHSTTASLYKGSVRNVVLSAMEGYHASVFAYGQTSTGKTFTMTGTKESPGIAPLAVKDCFQYVANLNSPREYLIRVSYMEIYNEQIVDLLVPMTDRHSPHQPAIRIFESKQEGVIVRGLREEVVSSPEEVFSLISSGEARRQYGSTNMNSHSSRSHCIFRLLIESRVPKNGTTCASSVASSSSSIATESSVGGVPVRVSSLSLVDLAGSESAKLTGSTGDRRKEGQYINKSLSTLGRVIFLLSEMSLRSRNSSNTTSSTRHIPYRDSKLTRLLQPSLSGNAQVVIICNISPQITHLEESHNTLKFAMRAKRIQQSASVTEVVDEKTLLQSYRDEIEDLKQQLKSAQEAQKVLQEQKMATPYDDETGELVEAIRKMETLILKAKSSPSKKKDESKFDDFLLSSNLDGLLIDDDEVDVKNENEQQSSGNSEEDENIVVELHRIQGLLGSVLKRKGAAVPDGVEVLSTATPKRSAAFAQSYSTPKRDKEMEDLRAQLHEKEVATSLRKADSSFLQSQLAEKDNLLREVSKILDALEKRQLELEAENSTLKQKLAMLEAGEELLI